MSYEKHANYDQQWMFPPTLEDLLAKDHPARMIREFVDAQDLEALGFRMRASENGRPNYSANLLLKIWLYGYVSKIRSNRGLERACMESIGMLWLSGMQSPDHTTLFRFWRDNQKGIRKLFKQLLQVAASLDLVGMVLHAVDGTKILSAASDYKAWRRKPLEESLKKLDRAIDEIMKETERSSEAAGECRLPEGLKERQELRSKIEEQLKQLNEKDRDHLQPGDEEARMMKCRKGTKFAYNAQAVVDQDSKLIVAADVVSDESDNYQLMPMLEQTEQNLGRVAEQTVADNGYQATTQAAKAEEKSYSILVNLNEPDDQPYHASRFTYDVANDRCICPRGETLQFDGMKKRDKVQPYAVRVYRCANYENCPVRWQCSKSESGRTVQIHPNHDVLLRQRAKLKDERMRGLLKRRGVIIEPLFGWIKEPARFSPLDGARGWKRSRRNGRCYAPPLIYGDFKASGLRVNSYFREPCAKAISVVRLDDAGEG